MEQIFASHIDQDVREQACRQSGALSFQVRVRPAADGPARVEVERVMPATVPDYVRKFVGDTITVRQIEDWSAPDGQGARRAEIRLSIQGQPATMTGTAQLSSGRRRLRRAGHRRGQGGDPVAGTQDRAGDRQGDRGGAADRAAGGRGVGTLAALTRRP